MSHKILLAFLGVLLLALPLQNQRQAPGPVQSLYFCVDVGTERQVEYKTQPINGRILKTVIEVSGNYVAPETMLQIVTNELDGLMFVASDYLISERIGPGIKLYWPRTNLGDYIRVEHGLIAQISKAAPGTRICVWVQYEQ